MPAASAQSPNAASLTTERAGLIYDQCLAMEGAKASRADAAVEEVYPRAHQACTTLRATLLEGFEESSERASVFKQIDEGRAKSFAQSTRRQRELRGAQ